MLNAGALNTDAMQSFTRMKPRKIITKCSSNITNI
jgi:hypothetical protein